MSQLYRRTSIFVDARNVMVATDAIVACRFQRYMHNNPTEIQFFTSDCLWMMKTLHFPAVKNTILGTKQNRNFLLDYFNWECVTESSNINPHWLCEFLYQNILAMEPDDTDVLGQEDIEPALTGIGASFKNLIKDENINHLHIYLDHTIPDYLEKKLTTYLNGSTKLFFVKGDKKDYFNTHQFDSYFLEDVTDIDQYITKPHSALAEILVPASANNLTVVEREGNTGLRLVSTDHPNKHYQETIHTNIFTIGLPI